MIPIVVAVMVAGAVFALAMLVVNVDRSHTSALEQRLARVTGAGPEPDATREVGRDPGLVRDVVTLTGRMADRIGLLERVEQRLVQADLPLRAPEAIAIATGVMALAFLVSLLVLGPVAAVLVAGIAAVGPFMYLEFRRKKRLRRFEEQLPNTLNLLSGSLRAGFSFIQGLEAVAEEASEPTRRELQRVFGEARLGRPVEDALADTAERMHSVDLEWAVMAIRIQREVGGNLAELLDTVAHTMTDRERLRHEVAALTAEGRMSAWVLGVFPPAFGVILYLLQPSYMAALLHDPIGLMALAVSAVMAVLGFVWLRKIMRIEV